MFSKLEYHIQHLNNNNYCVIIKNSCHFWSLAACGCYVVWKISMYKFLNNVWVPLEKKQNVCSVNNEIFHFSFGLITPLFNYRVIKINLHDKYILAVFNRSKLVPLGSQINGKKNCSRTEIVLPCVNETGL